VTLFLTGSRHSKSDDAARYHWEFSQPSIGMQWTANTHTLRWRWCILNGTNFWRWRRNSAVAFHPDSGVTGAALVLSRPSNENEI
jgi:hypothetical protein